MSAVTANQIEKNVKKFILAIMADKGLNQEKMARLIGTNQTKLSRELNKDGFKHLGIWMTIREAFREDYLIDEASGYIDKKHIEKRDLYKTSSSRIGSAFYQTMPKEYLENASSMSKLQSGTIDAFDSYFTSIGKPKFVDEMLAAHRISREYLTFASNPINYNLSIKLVKLFMEHLPKEFSSKRVELTQYGAMTGKMKDKIQGTWEKSGNEVETMRNLFKNSHLFEINSSYDLVEDNKDKFVSLKLNDIAKESNFTLDSKTTHQWRANTIQGIIRKVTKNNSLFLNPVNMTNNEGLFRIETI